MDPKTKSEAKRLIERRGRAASAYWDTACSPMSDLVSRNEAMKNANRHESEAARLRALLHTLPE